MTVRERILAKRLIQKIEHNKSYANQIGLSYVLSAVDTYKKNEEAGNRKKRTTKEKDL